MHRILARYLGDNGEWTHLVVVLDLKDEVVDHAFSHLHLAID